MPPHHGDPAASTVPLGELLARAGAYVGIEPAGASSGLQREAVASLAELLGRVEALLTAWVGAFDASCVHAGDGEKTAGGWLHTRSELDRGHAGALVGRARELRECPVVEAAYGDGRLGTAKVRALLDARTVHPGLFRTHEQVLVDEVAGLTVAHSRVAIARWRALAEETKAWDDARARAEREQEGDRASDEDTGTGGDGDEQPDAPPEPDPAPEPEPAPDAPGDPADENTLRLSQTFQGRWVLDGELDAVSGSELAEALAAYIDRQFQQGTWSSGDGRSAGYRRAHALLELVLRGSTAATRHGDPRPSVAVRIDPATLAGLPADGLAAGLERDCCLDDGTPIDARSVERLLCTARVQALWTRVRADGTVETLGVTDLLRDATRAQRRALKARDGRCIFPGCGAAAEWCEAHHVVPAEDLGPTLLANLVLLCRYHHHLVHEGGWTLWRDLGTGELHLVDPDHRPRRLTPPGVKEPVLDLDAIEPIEVPRPPHLRPPRFRAAHDPPG